MMAWPRDTAPQRHAAQQYQQRNRQEEPEIRQREPTLGDIGMRVRRPGADHRHNNEQHNQQRRGELAHPAKQRIFTFHNQPGGGQQCIGDHQAQPAEQVERRQPVQCAACKGASFHREAVDHRADDNPLAKGRQYGAAEKRHIPPGTVRFSGFKAKLKRHATENQADQHQHNRDGQRVCNNRVGQRERTKQSRTAHNQPGFVAVPHRGDAVDHHIPVMGIADKRKQHANPQVKTIHNDIHQRREDDDNEPHNGQVDMHYRCSSSRRSPTAEIGRAGRPSVFEDRSSSG